MEKRNTCYESMHRLQVGPHTVRIWRTETTLLEAVHPERAKLLADIHALIDIPGLDAYALLSKIGCMERVAAVEVLDAHGTGSILYPDWV